MESQTNKKQLLNKPKLKGSRKTLATDQGIELTKTKRLDLQPEGSVSEKTPRMIGLRTTLIGK